MQGHLCVKGIVLHVVGADPLGHVQPVQCERVLGPAVLVDVFRVAHVAVIVASLPDQGSDWWKIRSYVYYRPLLSHSL